MHAEIIAIGDEITSGQTLDTNSRWLSQRLEELGVRVLYHTTVGDELAPSAAVFRQAIERSDIAIATGGLGPTADDLTREALAQAVGRELVLYPEALEQIRSLFARRNREMPKQNELQALFPAGSRMIVNANGTAPGIDLDIPREGRDPCRFFALPGVPAEMRELWDSHLLSEISKLAGGSKKIVRRKINCFGAGESQIEAMLPDLVRRGRSPTVGITASNASISLRIAAEGATEEECNALIEPVVKTIRDCLGDLVFGEGDDELQHAVVRLLLEKRQTLSVIDGNTGGLISQWLCDVPDADECFLGGLVTPNAQKVDPILGLHFTTLNSVSGRNESSPFLLPTAQTGRNPASSDWTLVVCDATDCDRGGSSPADPSRQDPHDSLTIHLINSRTARLETKNVPYGFTPALRKIFFAKQALNFLRLVVMCQ
jgi:nicotinamide-nucleotide amidase